MSDKNDRVCHVERAGPLDSVFRRWFQNPRRILGPYLEEGMTVMDIGCGPGFFSVYIARMVGESGRVIACDLQEGMLGILRDKIRGTELEERITLHRCSRNHIDWKDEVDFALAFYVLHELPDQRVFFEEVASILKPGGNLLIVEPPLHVSKKAFAETISKARDAGFSPEKGPRLSFNKTVVLRKS